MARRKQIVDVFLTYVKEHPEDNEYYHLDIEVWQDDRINWDNWTEWKYMQPLVCWINENNFNVWTCPVNNGKAFKVNVSKDCCPIDG